MDISKIIKTYERDELWEPLRNVSFFLWGCGWNNHKYFERYKDKTKAACFIIMNEKNNLGLFLGVKKMKRLFQEVFDNYLENPKSIQPRKKCFKEIVKKINFLYLESKINFLKELSIKDLIKLMSDSADMVWQLNASHFFTAYPIDENFFITKLNRREISQERLKKNWPEITNPINCSFDAQKTLYIANLIKSGKSQDEIVELCQYFYVDYFRVPESKEVEKRLKKDFGYIKNKAAAISIIENERKKYLSKKKRLEEFKKRLAFREKKLTEFIQYLIEYRDNRKNEFNKGFVIMWRVAEEICGRIGIDTKIIPFISLADFRKGEKYLRENRDIFEKRLKGASLFIDYNGKVKINPVDYKKTERDISYAYLKHRKNKLEGNILRGSTGSPGKVQGRIRKIVQYNPRAKFKKNEILVTGMTRPEFISLMKKAAAVITDEGGITCHAAIVSRELGIPCVIGTKIATQVLKDGDLVEVDAKKGIVRILKRKKK